MQRQQSSAAPSSRRRELDYVRIASDPQYVVTPTDSVAEFYVLLRGPAGTPYAGGVWNIRVGLPEQYPFKSPSIGFANRIYHPNIDEASGSVCLDVINQTWTPMYALTNILDTFLPQLLRYPNPTDPLNPEAAALLLHDPAAYAARVQDHVCRFGTKTEAERAVARCLSGHDPHDSPQTDFSRGLSATPPSSLGQKDGEHEDSDGDESYEPEEIDL